MTIFSHLQAFLAIILIGQVPGPPGEYAGSIPAIGLEGAELSALLDQARAVQRSDLEAWHRFEFTRRVVRERLATDGSLSSREVLDFIVTPLEEGFLENLRLINGLSPSRRQIAKHREAARFTTRYREALGGADGSGKSAGDASSYGMRVPLTGRSFHHLGREMVDGIRCHKLALEEEPQPGESGIRARIAAAVIGTIWLNVEDLHIVRAELHAAHPVAGALGLVKLLGLDILMETRLQDAEIRLPSRIEVRTDLRILGFVRRTRNEFLYSGFRESSAHRQAAPSSPNPLL